MQPHGPWQIVRSREAHRDPWTRVRVDEVIRPDGAPGTYTVIHLKPGVSVLAMDDARNVYLTEEFHYGVGRVTLEAASGGVEPGETPLEAARRELKEELGIEAREWTHLGTVDPFTANVVSPTQLYLARGLSFGPPEQEGTEEIRLAQMPLARAFELAMQSEITHAPSSVLILKAWLTVSREPVARARENR
jgi:ADP-ribose pyrophosphatase